MIRATAVALVLVIAAAAPALAFEAAETFRKGTLVASLEGGGGQQHNFGNDELETGLEFFNAGLRVSLLPFEPVLAGEPLWGAFEIGLEPFYQRYVHPERAFFAGLGASVRYHFLGLGRVVPYVEAFAAAGGTDLRTDEIASTFTFLLFVGSGVSVFVNDRTALYAGYRYQHVSNGGTSQPNRGFESHTGVAGVSVFFP